MNIDGLIKKYPIRQIGFFVPDCIEAAKKHNAIFGSGPYLVVENMEMQKVLHRGKPAELNHSCCFGMWGDVQVEFCQQNSEGDSYYKDTYPDFTSQGFHHFAIFSDDVEETIKEFESLGYALGTRMVVGGDDSTNSEMLVVMIDCRKDFNCFIEVYPPPEPLYSMIRDMAKDWDGMTDVIRSV
ncbi:MAG: hypothetical protein HGA54_09065 [Actinobacteria bacterium]|nr:hypothetical protein [Actinomycetota bacterium]